jgi:hypothetical protein
LIIFHNFPSVHVHVQRMSLFPRLDKFIVLISLVVLKGTIKIPINDTSYSLSISYVIQHIGHTCVSGLNKKMWELIGYSFLKLLLYSSLTFTKDESLVFMYIGCNCIGRYWHCDILHHYELLLCLLWELRWKLWEKILHMQRVVHVFLDAVHIFVRWNQWRREPPSITFR